MWPASSPQRRGGVWIVRALSWGVWLAGAGGCSTPPVASSAPAEQAPHDSAPPPQRNQTSSQPSATDPAIDPAIDPATAQAVAGSIAAEAGAQRAPGASNAQLAQGSPHTQDGPQALEHLRPLNPKAIAFEAACDPGDRLTIAAVGDLLVHKTIQVQAMTHPDRFRSLWGDVDDLLQRAELTYANLEGPTAPGVTVRQRDVPDPGLRFDDDVYTSYPRFNYHPSMLDDLKLSGVDVVSTANNHSLDRGVLGADRTIEQLERVGIKYTGTRRSTHDQPGVSSSWHTITEAKGFRVAWLACTFSTNGRPDPKRQVLFCYEDRAEVLRVIRELSADASIDAVIVTPHWGLEYTQTVRPQEQRLARDLIEAGALAVLASHPHVLQRWELHQAKDGRQGFILYSLGNFVSNMDDMEKRATMLLYLGLTRRASDKKVVLNGARYAPLFMYRDKTRRYVRDIERGEPAPKALAHVTTLLGAYNLYKTTDPWTTTPQCDASWRPPVEPHPHNGWLGGACASDEDCALAPGARCDRRAPQGMCVLPCQGVCPALRGRSPLLCASSPDEALGAACSPSCSRDTDCRPGYACVARSILTSKGGASKRKVCSPR